MVRPDSEPMEISLLGPDDQYYIPVPITGEPGRVTKGESRGGDAATRSKGTSFVFWVVDLQAQGIRDLQPDDLIIHNDQFWSVASTEYRMRRQRCEVRVDPAHEPPHYVAGPA